MSDWLILVEAAGDLAQHETPHKVMRLRDYIANPKLFTGRRPNVVNLARVETPLGACSERLVLLR